MIFKELGTSVLPTKNKMTCPDCGAEMQGGVCPDCGSGDDGDEGGTEEESLGGPEGESEESDSGF